MNKGVDETLLGTYFYEWKVIKLAFSERTCLNQMFKFVIKCLN